MTPLSPPLLPAAMPWAEFLGQWAFLVALAVLVIAAWHGLRRGK